MSLTADEFWKILHDIPEPKPIFHRLYYNDDGSIVCYTMEDLPGKYIEIDQATYSRGLLNIRVVNEKIVEIVPPTMVKKLKPLGTGTACDPQNICVIVSCSEPHQNWSIKTNEVN